MLLVIAISVGATLLFTRDSGNGPTQSANGSPPAAGDIASANDTGPVGIVTDDPSCQPWRSINDALAEEQSDSWVNRDYSRPASVWTTEEREIHEQVADAMDRAAEKTVQLVKMTPHRIMRELFEQSIAYWRAYADAIGSYTPSDNHLAVAASDAGATLVAICAAIDYESAATWAPLVPPGPTPNSIAPIGDPSNPEMFIGPSGDPICEDWLRLTTGFENSTKEWRESDLNIPASQWQEDQRALMEETGAVMTTFANNIATLAGESENPTLQDLSNLTGQYLRAYVESIPTYTTADSFFASAGTRSYLIVSNACGAAGS
ncbi:hypothetical protein [Mycolicibacterium bacteremicum]|uniref:hypothetical protein n=1 Tax=Mycolicibacterium bacteremicum TaxID=564198 RepID=UPI00105617BD|nr:hypothetical protein [Mycolicibacterium bacteremicum]MCV7434540.1 hypothetical protein [Mycolicibacterium bacteremicum]